MEDENHNHTNPSNTQRSTQEQEFTDDECSKVYSKPKEYPSIRKRSQYDSDGRMQIIQSTYDMQFVETRRKKQNAEKRRQLKAAKSKNLSTAVKAVDRKRKTELKHVDDTKPNKKRSKSLKKYEPVDTPGQQKLTSFVTPSQNSFVTPSQTTTNKAPSSTPSTLAETSVSSSNQVSATPTLASSVKTNSFASPQAKVPAAVAGNDDDCESVSSVGTPMLPNMLARCRGVCNGCFQQFHLCHEAQWRDTCMHAVIDYFDTVGYDMITLHGIRQAYYNHYVVMAKTDL